MRNDATVKLLCKTHSSHKYYQFDSDWDLGNIWVKYGPVNKTLSHSMFCSITDTKKLANQIRSKLKKGYVFENIDGNHNVQGLGEAGIEMAVLALTNNQAGANPIRTATPRVVLERFDPASLDMHDINSLNGTCPVW